MVKKLSTNKHCSGLKTPYERQRFFVRFYPRTAGRLIEAFILGISPYAYLLQESEVLEPDSDPLLFRYSL